MKERKIKIKLKQDTLDFTVLPVEEEKKVKFAEGKWKSRSQALVK
jgi:hypothetical protein